MKLSKKIASVALAGAICVTGLGLSKIDASAQTNDIVIEQSNQARMTTLSLSGTAGNKYITIKASAVPAGVSLKVVHESGIRRDTLYGTMPSGAGSVTHKFNLNRALAKGDYISVECRGYIYGLTIR